MSFRKEGAIPLTKRGVSGETLIHPFVILIPYLLERHEDAGRHNNNHRSTKHNYDYCSKRNSRIRSRSWIDNYKKVIAERNPQSEMAGGFLLPRISPA